MSRKPVEPDPIENPFYHDTWLLLKKYRDAHWSMEISVQNARYQFNSQFGGQVDDFLESVYSAGTGVGAAALEQYTHSIERSRKMLQLLDQAINIMRTKHKYGEDYYWILYYTYLSPQAYSNTDIVIEHIHEHIRSISSRTYFRRKKTAIQALSSILWGFTSRECLEILEHFIPDRVKLDAPRKVSKNGR